MRRLTLVLSVALLCLAPALPARAVTPGVDVGQPQTTATLPDPAGTSFAVVGVNGTTFANLNPDLARQWAYAAGLARAPQLYVLSADPGSRGASWGQPGQRPCDGSDGDPGCAYNYGYAGAVRALDAATGIVDRPSTWWVDVELGAPTWGAVSQNVQVLAGELAGLASRPGLVARSGIYTHVGTGTETTDYQTIMGSEPSTLPVWAATSYGDAVSALGACTAPSPTGGPVVQVQAPALHGGIDSDAVCPPRVTLSAGRRAVQGPSGRAAVVRGTGLPGSTVTLSATDLAGHAVRLPHPAAGVGAGGTWSASVPLTADALLRVTGADGAVGAADLRPAVAVTARAAAGRAACTSVVTGTTSTWWPGERVTLPGTSAPVHQRGGSGAFSVTLRGACGQTVTAYVDGRGTGHRRVTAAGSSRPLHLPA